MKIRIIQYGSVWWINRIIRESKDCLQQSKYFSFKVGKFIERAKSMFADRRSLILY